MSVINQVLNDIEKRNNTEQGVNIDALEPLEPAPLKRNYLPMVLIVLLVTCIASAWFLLRPTVSQWLEDVPVSISKAELRKLDAEKKSVIAPPVNMDKSGDKNASVPVRKTVKTMPPVTALAAKDNNDEVTKLTAQAITPQSSSTKRQRKKEQPVVKAPIEKAPLPVKRTPTKVVSQPVTVVGKSKPNGNETLSIKTVQLTTQELAQLKLKQGLRFQSNGQLKKSRQYWREALHADSSLHQARELLAASHFGANESISALQILQQGIQYYPKHDSYRLLMAQIYYQLEQLNLALNALNSPYLHAYSSLDNLALAGSLAQQLEVWPQAQLNYQKLNQLVPDNQDWLMGLAISFDAQQNVPQAIQGYFRLLKLPQIDKTLYDYAHERVLYLKSIAHDATQATRDSDG